MAGHVRVVRRKLAAELEAARTTAGDGERWLRTPVAGRVGPGGIRHVERLDVDVDVRLVHDAVVYPLEPVVAPTHGEMLARQATDRVFRSPGRSGSRGR